LGLSVPAGRAPTRSKGVAQYAHSVLSGRVRLAPQVGQTLGAAEAGGEAVSETMGAIILSGDRAAHLTRTGGLPARPAAFPPLFRPIAACTIAFSEGSAP
jgi:hypothetical protein